MGPGGFYGVEPAKVTNTISSLILSILPPFDFKFQNKDIKISRHPTSVNLEVYMLEILLEFLRNLLGFKIPHVSFFSLFCNIHTRVNYQLSATITLDSFFSAVKEQDPTLAVVLGREG